jgi:hypothetical protein
MSHYGVRVNRSPKLDYCNKQQFVRSNSTNDGSPDPRRLHCRQSSHTYHDLHDVTAPYLPTSQRQGCCCATVTTSQRQDYAGLLSPFTIPNAIQQVTGYISALALAICLLQNKGRFVRRLSARFTTTGLQTTKDTRYLVLPLWLYIIAQTAMQTNLLTTLVMLSRATCSRKLLCSNYIVYSHFFA